MTEDQAWELLILKAIEIAKRKKRKEREDKLNEERKAV